MIIVRERFAESTSLSRPDLAGSRDKTVSRPLELSPDAVDGHPNGQVVVTCTCVSPSRKHADIMLTPLNHSKTGVYRVYIIFLISAEAVLTSTHNLCFEQKYEKYKNFYLKSFVFVWW